MGDSIKRYIKFVKPYNWQIVLTILIGIVKFAIPLLFHYLLKLSLMTLSDQISLTKAENDAAIVLLAWWDSTCVLYHSAAS